MTAPDEVIKQIENIDNQIINLLRKRISFSRELIKRPDYLIHHKHQLAKVTKDIERIKDAAEHEKRFLKSIYKKMMQRYKQLLKQTKHIEHRL